MLLTNIEKNYSPENLLDPICITLIVNKVPIKEGSVPKSQHKRTYIWNITPGNRITIKVIGSGLKHT